MRNKEIARETVEILDRGHYRSPGGRQVDLSAALAACVANTACYDPEQLASIRDQVLAQPAEFAATDLEVANEATLQGGARLAASGQYARIGALNFASARNPGGGF